MIEIRSHKVKPYCEIAVPGSKSLTHRILIASALSKDLCSIENALLSEDTVLTMKALRQMGIRIEDKSGNRLAVYEAILVQARRPSISAILAPPSVC